jgi:hypothetical protein
MGEKELVVAWLLEADSGMCNNADP